jgi:Glycosyl hydrolase family 9/Cellulase N-terminal ig-like domain
VDRQSLALPAVGDCSLRILSSTILEFTQISSEADGRPVPPAFRVTVGGQPVGVIAVGTRRRVAYAPLAHRDLRIATVWFIRVATAIDLNEASRFVEVRELGATPRVAVAACDPGRTSPVIHVNQEGYAPSLPKKAMVGYYLGDMGEMDIPASYRFALVEARSGATAYVGRLAPRPDVGFKTTPVPYQKVFVADFSDFAKPGEYRLLVPGLGKSLPFLIDEGIAMGFARTYALGLYGQRCGGSNALPFTRFVHDACHTAGAQVPEQSDPQFAFTWATIARYAGAPNPNNPAQVAPPLTSEANQLYPFVRRGTVDVSGGHHDAGDYSKYTENSAELVHYLVFSVDSIPGVAAMDNLGIPESGDGIPDVLQEAKWEADFLAKMQDADGGFYFLVYPKDREYESNVLPQNGDPQVVWPKNTSVTAAAVAALAEAGSSPAMVKFYPQAAAQYLKEAQLGWQFLTNAIAKYGKAGAYQKITFYSDDWTHDDELAWAAAAMYAATGNTAYQTQLFQWFPNPADPSTFRWGWWRMSEGWGNAIRTYAFAARSGRLPQSALDPNYLAACEGQVVASADDALDWSRKSAYATPFPEASKAVNRAGWYFSVDQACDMAVAYAIKPRPAYIDALVGAMNYEAGCNPVNVTFLTGLGSRRQREIVDQYAQNGRTILPPSGIPIGNIQSDFQYVAGYGSALGAATYPGDYAATGPYPLYDRWSDAYNVTQEFIAVNQARGLLVTAFLAGLSHASGRPWTHARAVIALPAATVPLNSTVTLGVSVPGESLRLSRIVWEARDQQPAFGPTFTFAPRNSGEQWVEAEVEWPDGRRAFAADSFMADSATVTWLDGAVPAGSAIASSGGDGWNWISSDTTGRPGSLCHESSLSGGLHEHGFSGASATLAVGVENFLFAWVYIDPANPPMEIMLSWNDGASWEHRAYWGADMITYGQGGTAGRHPEGVLPAAGRWVQLRAKASDVGLEGSTLSGMSFSLFGGRAIWGAAGRAR